MTLRASWYAKAIGLLVVAAVILGVALSPLVALLVLSVGTAWLLPYAWPYLILLAGASEFVSIEPLGVASAAALLPGIVRWFARSAEPELSGTYLAWLAAAAAAPLAWFIGAEAIQAWWNDQAFTLRQLPWLELLRDWLAVTGTVAAVLAWLSFRHSSAAAAARRPYTIQSFRF